MNLGFDTGLGTLMFLTTEEAEVTEPFKWNAYEGLVLWYF